MAARLSFERAGTRLSALDFGGDGPTALLLHGLAGTAEEWAGTAAWLNEQARVLAPDMRGHGQSEWRPTDVSLEARVEDAVVAIESFAPGPVLCIGQSLGGQTAFALAARRPDLVRSLVVVEADPAHEDPARLEEVAGWLRSSPEREGDLPPSFEAEVLIDMLAQAGARSYWDDWEAIDCPTLLVRGARGDLPRDRAMEMVARCKSAALVEIADAGHDVHLDQPQEWRRELERFLRAAGDAG